MQNTHSSSEEKRNWLKDILALLGAGILEQSSAIAPDLRSDRDGMVRRLLDKDSPKPR